MYAGNYAPNFTIVFLVVMFTIFIFINAVNNWFTCILLAEDRHKNLAEMLQQKILSQTYHRSFTDNKQDFTDPSNFAISRASLFKYQIQTTKHFAVFLSLQKRNQLTFNTYYKLLFVTLCLEETGLKTNQMSYFAQSSTLLMDCTALVMLFAFLLLPCLLQ